MKAKVRDPWRRALTVVGLGGMLVMVPGVLESAALADRIEIGIREGADRVRLQGRDAAQQLVATAVGEDGTRRDVTGEVAWEVTPGGLAVVDAGGYLVPRQDGTGRILAAGPGGETGEMVLEIEGSGEEAPIHFANEIVPVFTKYGCNGGGCHGKAAGQNGFRLSLLGFEPAEDYDHLVREARGRRVFPAAPEHSLLLTKATGQLPHGGGARMNAESEDYRLVLRWIRQGMPTGRADAPTVVRIEVYPAERILRRGGTQQLAVTAHYSDGRTQDVTRRALYESNDPDLARPDEGGRVQAAERPGEIGVMVRYQGHVATFRGTLPLGAPVKELPSARNFVDEEVFRQWRRVGMPPSGLSDDATFLRRVTLDVAGRLPTPREVARFESEVAEERARLGTEGEGSGAGRARGSREAVIDRLLGGGDYADYFANKWSALLRNRRNDTRQTAGTFLFHRWIRDSLQRNKPYDQFVREIVAASGTIEEHPPVAWYRQVRSMQAQLEDVSQLFLGQRLQCAQCHHHPYEKWSQADYWGFGAFFAQVGYRPSGRPGEDAVFHRRGEAKATNKKTGQPVRPAGLGDEVGELGLDEDPRWTLAEWMTREDNPYFARALVNRYWKHFFGRGLVEPEDDLRETNPATHPELLRRLGREFVASGYDLRWLVRTLTESTTYQLSAMPNAWNGADRHHFSRFQPRRLPAEVLLDSVNTLLGARPKFEGLPAGVRAVALPDNSYNAGTYFLTVFGRPDSSSACECERSSEASLSQSLHLLNAKEIQERLAADDGRAAALARDSSRSDEGKLREVYVLAYGRQPETEELGIGLAHLKRKTESAADDAGRLKAQREAWEDTLWALMNSKEFLFNH